MSCLYKIPVEKGELNMKNQEKEIQRIKDQPLINKSTHGNQFCPYSSFPSIVLYYPGKKKPGDYKLEFNGKIVYHKDIAEAIYELSPEYSFELIEFITNLYNDGLDAEYSSRLPETIMILNHSINFEEFKYLIFFTILQEDINYPRPRWQGIKLPLHRFIEAAIAGYQPNVIKKEEVINRINNHGGGIPKSLVENKELHPKFKKALINI